MTSASDSDRPGVQSSVDGDVTQYKDWGIPLGRRFRALKLWFHLRLDGAEAIRARLRRDLENAQWLAAQVRDEPEWELVAPVPLQTVCVRHVPAMSAGDRTPGGGSLGKVSARKSIRLADSTVSLTHTWISPLAPEVVPVKYVICKS